MSTLETTAYYAFGVPLYLGLMGVEAWRARRRGAPTLSLADSVGNLSAGLGSIAVGLCLGPALIALYEWGYAHLALVHWHPGAWQPWVLAWVLADFGHYWHHRLDHRVAACWAVHGVHHQPVEMNFTVAIRHAWFSDLYSFPFYVPVVLAGVPASHFFVATTALSFHALITHTDEFDFPSLGFLVTPRSHTLHHAKNPRYLDRNFGAMLSVWDRLFGTHVERDPAEAPVYGTVHGYETHDGARAQWVLVRDLAGIVRRSPSLRDGLRALVARPGWTPPGIDLPPAVPPRPSRNIPRGTRLYVVAQYALTLALSLAVFIPREHFTMPELALAAVAICFSLHALGALLDGLPHAWRMEALRLSALGALGLAWARGTF